MKRILIVLLASLFVTGAVAQVESTAASETMADVIAEASQEGWMQIDVEDAADYIFQVEPLILDVRSEGEFENGYLEGAVNIPVTELSANLDELPSDLDTPILVYCGVGVRGFWGLSYMTSLGYTNVQNMSGGYKAWVENDYPTVTP